MKNLEIYIAGRRLNFINREGFPVSLNYSIESAENPSQINGAHSKRTAIFPGDGVSTEFFEELEATTRDNPNAALARNASVEVNGITVLAGKAQIESVTTGSAQSRRYGSEYKVALLGNNAAWFSELQDKAVRDIGMIPVHTLGLTYVSAHDNPDPDTDTHGYFLLRTIDFLGNGDNVVYADLQPFLFIRPMLIEAFRQVGYHFDSDFFDTELGKRLIMPALFRPYPEEVANAWTLLAMDENNGTSVNISTWTSIHIGGDKFMYNPGGHYNTGTGEYTVPFSGYYILGLETDSIQFFHRVQKNNVTVLAQFTDPCEIGIGVQARVLLGAGDTIELVVKGNISPVQFCFLYVRPDMGAFEDGTGIDFSLYGNPTWKVSDVVLGLTHAFGLVWNTDFDAQRVTVEPRDRYKVTAQPTTDGFHEGFYRVAERDDITPKIDLSKSGEVQVIRTEKSRLVLAWKSDGNDGNIEAVEYDAETKPFDGLFEYAVGRFQEGEKRSENPFFCKTLHILDNQIMHYTSTKTPQIPLIQKNVFLEGNPRTDERGDFGPRLLWFAGRREGLDGLVNIEDYGSYDYPCAFMVNYNDETGLDPSLSFANETLRDGVSIPEGLINRFHLQRLKRLEVGKMLVDWVRWNEIDILSMDFRKKYLVGEALYLLQKINAYKPISDGSTETELLYDAIPITDDVDKISGSDLPGYIISPIPNGF